jgi:hypothetical protein
MARVDGVHGPEKKPQVQFIDEWSKLKAALNFFRDATVYDLVDGLVDYSGIELSRDAVTYRANLIDQLPRLMDAYAELWELMEGLIKAREQLEASKNDLYVPDAAEMVQGAIANPERTQR